MLQFNKYESSGRTLMIKFTCSRCGKEIIEPLAAHADDSKEPYGHLHYIKPPEGWKKLLHGPLLCEACYNKYLKFMDNTIGG